MEQRDDGFFVKGGMHCPRCWRFNAPSATVCRECGADLVPEVREPVAVKVEKKKVDLTWLRGYGVACWIIMAVIAIIGLIMFVINALAGNWGDALMALVCASALAVIHLTVGKGLWLMQNWARTTAFQMHGLMLIWGLAIVIFSISGLEIRYVDHVLTLPVMLALIGGLALWVGARAEEGERLAVNGPDPDAIAEIAAAPAKVVNNPANISENAALLNMSPYPQRAILPTDVSPETPVTSVYRVNTERNANYDVVVEQEKDKKQEKMKRTAIMVGATAVLNFLQNRKRAREYDDEYYEDEGSTSGKKSQAKRRPRQRSAAQQRRGGGIMSIIKMFLDQ